MDMPVRPRVTYVLEPSELVHLRIRPHDTLEIHVVALFDVVRIQRFAHSQVDHRLVLHIEPPLILLRAVGYGGIFRAARQIFTVVLYGWHEAEDTQTLIVLELVLQSGVRITREINRRISARTSSRCSDRCRRSVIGASIATARVNSSDATRKLPHFPRRFIFHATAAMASRVRR